MSCSRKAIYDDEDRYEALCSLYGVSPVVRDGFLDNYGIHGKMVERYHFYKTHPHLMEKDGVKEEDIALTKENLENRRRESRRQYLLIRREKAEKELQEIDKELVGLG